MVVGPPFLIRCKISFIVFKSKCMGSYLENHLRKNLFGAPLYLPGSVDLYGLNNVKFGRVQGKSSNIGCGG